MKNILFILIILIFSTASWSQDNQVKTYDVKITTEELKLYDLLMKYRESKNLPDIPLSKSLTYVAQVHCKDLSVNKADSKPGGCNAHSWSNKGKWTSCCYTPDHAQAKCMWNKPKELTNYQDNGFEIACGSSEDIYKSFVMTPEYAIESWQKSVHHNDVIINGDIWKDHEWKAIGIGIYEGFAVVWFGESIDKDGEPAK